MFDPSTNASHSAAIYYSSITPAGFSAMATPQFRASFLASSTDSAQLQRAGGRAWKRSLAVASGLLDKHDLIRCIRSRAQCVSFTFSTQFSGFQIIFGCRWRSRRAAVDEHIGGQLILGTTGRSSWRICQYRGRLIAT
jgi:hypothetical protein